MDLDDIYTFDFVLEAFKSYGHDILLEAEWYDYLKNNGVSEEDLKKVTLELDQRGFLSYTVFPSIFLEDFVNRVKGYGIVSSSSCVMVSVCVLGVPKVEKELHGDLVIVYFRDGSYVTYAQLRNMVERAFKYFKRDIVSDLEFIGFLMRFYGFSLERAFIISHHPLSLPDVEFGWMELSEVENSLRDWGLLGLAKKWLICLDKEDLLPSIVRLNKS